MDEKHGGTSNKAATMPVEEARQVMGISRSAFYRAVSRGDIPVIRLGKRILIPRPGLERLLIEGNR